MSRFNLKKPLVKSFSFLILERNASDKRCLLV